MRRIVTIFGLIAGVVMSVMMVIQMSLIDRLGFDHSLIVGYASMVAAFLLVYFGTRRYRDDVLGGTISFWRAFSAGILITLIASVCYSITWEVVYYNMMPDFMDKYAASELAKAQAAGVSAQEIAAKSAEMARYKEMYKNPFIIFAMTMMEPLPVGLLISLVSAGLLRRQRVSASPSSVGAVSPA